MENADQRSSRDLSERAARAVLRRFCLWRPCRAPERRKPIRSTVPQGASVEVFGAGQACSRHQTAYREAIPFPFKSLSRVLPSH
jgi:hypothetical protein